MLTLSNVSYEDVIGIVTKDLYIRILFIDTHFYYVTNIPIYIFSLLIIILLYKIFLDKKKGNNLVYDY